MIKFIKQKWITLRVIKQKWITLKFKSCVKYREFINFIKHWKQNRYK